MATICAEAPWSPPAWSSPPGTAVTGKSELVLVASEDHCGCTKAMGFYPKNICRNSNEDKFKSLRYSLK